MIRGRADTFVRPAEESFVTECYQLICPEHLSACAVYNSSPNVEWSIFRIK